MEPRGLAPKSRVRISSATSEVCIFSQPLEAALLVPQGIQLENHWYLLCCFPNLYRSCSACKFRTCSWKNKEGRETTAFLCGRLSGSRHTCSLNTRSVGKTSYIIPVCLERAESTVGQLLGKWTILPAHALQRLLTAHGVGLGETNSHLAGMASCKSASSGQIY